MFEPNGCDNGDRPDGESGREVGGEMRQIEWPDADKGDCQRSVTTKATAHRPTAAIRVSEGYRHVLGAVELSIRPLGYHPQHYTAVCVVRGPMSAARAWLPTHSRSHCSPLGMVASLWR